MLADKAPHIAWIFVPLLEDYFQSSRESQELAGYYTQTFHGIQRYYHRDHFKQSRKLPRSERKGGWGFFNRILKLFGLISFSSSDFWVFFLLSPTSSPVLSPSFSSKPGRWVPYKMLCSLQVIINALLS